MQPPSTHPPPPPPPPGPSKTIVTVEILVSKSHPKRLQDVEKAVASHVAKTVTVYCEGEVDLNPLPKDVAQGVEAIRIHVHDVTGKAAFFQAQASFHAYRMYEGTEDQVAMDEHDGSSTTLFSLRELPNKEYDGLWESIILEPGVKERLLGYAKTGLLFSDYGVRAQTISCNRVILLHGPPGTGKTTMAQALAHKLSIQMCSTRYIRGSHILEVNSHSLFSRWFSESGKLVQKMFEHIRELAHDPDMLVFVLIDEVESLTASRNAGGSDPSDAMRVVNALLTQLDRLKDQMNVMIIATSNVTTSIDAAFVDRADVKLYLGPPAYEARLAVLRSCLVELQRAGLISMSEFDHRTLQQGGQMVDPPPVVGSVMHWLMEATKASQGLSGRALRKIPIQAFSFYLPLLDGCDVDENGTNKKLPRYDATEVAKAFYTAIVDENKNRERLLLKTT